MSKAAVGRDGIKGMHFWPRYLGRKWTGTGEIGNFKPGTVPCSVEDLLHCIQLDGIGCVL
jgi:hypothetical protein